MTSLVTSIRYPIILTIFPVPSGAVAVIKPGVDEMYNISPTVAALNAAYLAYPLINTPDDAADVPKAIPNNPVDVVLESASVCDQPPKLVR